MQWVLHELKRLVSASHKWSKKVLSLMGVEEEVRREFSNTEKTYSIQIDIIRDQLIIGDE